MSKRKLRHREGAATSSKEEAELELGPAVICEDSDDEHVVENECSNDDDDDDDDNNDDSEDEVESEIDDESDYSEAVDNEDHTHSDNRKLSSWDDAECTDSSDEEELRNTVGNIPLEWYNDYPHIGYDIDGEKIIKPLRGDKLDDFLKKMDDPNYWRTVSRGSTDVVLTDEDIELIERIQSSQYPDQSHDPYAPFEDLYSHEKMIHPISNRPEPKRSFLPSLWERKKVTRMVRAIKSGSLKPITKPDKPRFYMIWSDSGSEQANKLRPHQFIPAPKTRLPSHAESYNPPPEFLPSDKRRENAKPNSFIPTKYSSLRLVPAYPAFIKERFERCLDLYLCPRQTRMRIKVDPDSLIPKLPSPKDLQPFPTTECIVYRGHTGLVRSIDVDKEGVWLASVCDDCTLKLWEVSTGRCIKTIPLAGKSSSVKFCPHPDLSILAVTVDKSISIINHCLGDRLVVTATDSALSSFSEDDTNDDDVIKWRHCGSTSSSDDFSHGYRYILDHSKAILQVTWHFKGDYFASVCNEGGVSSVYIHQLSKRRSQNPFKKLKGLVQAVAFHPSKPLFFVATQIYVRIYDLMKQELVKKLSPGVKWISSLSIHPKGDNLIIGSYDKRLCWFDLDLSTKPYRMLRHHRQAVRSVCYHNTYPLFASSSDDGSVIVCHGMVYNDLMNNPLIVPVKLLKVMNAAVNSLGVMGCVFHPTQPWIFTAGADGLIKLYCN